MRKTRSAQYEAPAALIYCAILLILMEYFFIPPRAESWLNGGAYFGWRTPSLEAGLIWSASCVLGFLAIPCMLTKLLSSASLAEQGYSARGFLSHIRIYLLLYVGMLPLIYLASREPEFMAIYPFIPAAKKSLATFFVWECAYILQFFALESFFRGYLLFTLRRYTSTWVAICAMVVPYSMIHFHKPFPEAMAAVFAGVILGWLALRYRSWIGGAVLHSMVALTLDALSAARAGLFGRW